MPQPNLEDLPEGGALAPASAGKSGVTLVEEFDAAAAPSNVDLAIRLYLLDMTRLHLGRAQGTLGYGAHLLDQELLAERDRIVGHLRELGQVFHDQQEAQGERERAQRRVAGRR